MEWWVFGGFALFIWWRYARETAQAALVAETADVPADEPDAADDPVASSP